MFKKILVLGALAFSLLGFAFAETPCPDPNTPYGIGFTITGFLIDKDMLNTLSVVENKGKSVTCYYESKKDSND